ncbi:MAG: hypothetical protein R3242_01885 [Akkermansiaceae bacterium]|nr:hypothetical protein [Akkermansiaceae bacterium]
MKTTTFTTLFLSTALGIAGPELTERPQPQSWIEPSINIRARFEYGDLAAPGLERATAWTLRERIGFSTRDFNGFSALLEGEFLQYAGAYDSAPSAFTSQTTKPNPLAPRTQINDPETNELNRAHLDYQTKNTTFRAGRQRIILDNAAFVGNVGWRQNEQTYDAFSIANASIPDLTLFYAYANRANRIFGSDATGALRNFAGDIHLIHGSYDGLGETKITAYSYLMDFDETAANSGYISNNTYGIIAAGPVGPLKYHAEFAYQTDTGSSPATKPTESWYTHLNASYAYSDHTFTLGCEYLDAGFVTPLATVHAFNGYSDVFVAPRIGLVNNPGLADLYFSHSTPLPIWDVKFSQAIHFFGDNNANFDYGTEYDAVLTKQFSDHFLGIAKFALYDSKGASAGPISNIAPFDATRFSIEMNYSF